VRAHGQDPTIGSHRLLCIDGEVHDDLLQLVRIRITGRQIVRKFLADFDIVDAQLMIDNLKRGFDDRVDLRLCHLCGFLSRELQQVRDNVSASPRL